MYKMVKMLMNINFDRFGILGILCRHAFKMLMNINFDSNLDKYILRRWRKDVISSNYQLSRDRFDEEDADVTKLKLSCFQEKTQLLLDDVKSNSSNEVPITNFDVVERLYKVTIPEDDETFVPNV
uniref:Protein FAR1-RELATED SEQUENCE n=1 Tax=Lactuca sativa TaxID=4236 RepID=A0A9R1UNN5_LACSA|nr:hypothetical protein LSAT_V11C800440660 [Lactuca sativa]